MNNKIPEIPKEFWEKPRKYISNKKMFEDVIPYEWPEGYLEEIKKEQFILKEDNKRQLNHKSKNAIN